MRLLKTREEFVRPCIGTPSLNHANATSPEPVGVVEKVQVSPAHRTWESSGVAVSGCRRTMTENAQLLMLPLTSSAVHCTRFVPCAKVDPEGGEQTTVAPGQLSRTVGLNVATGLHVPLLPSMMMSPGQVSVGRSRSRMVS